MSGFIKVFEQPELVRVGWALVHSVWQAGGCALGLGAGMVVVKGSRGRYLMGCAALALAVALPVGTWVVIGGDAVPVLSAGAERVPVPSAEVFFGEGRVNAVVMTQSGEWAWSAVSSAVVAGLGAVWVLAVGGMGVLQVGAHLRIARAKGYGVLAVGEDVMEELAGKMGVRQKVRAVVSDWFDGPVVVGFLKPVILVPASVMSGISPAELEAVLLHELAHVRRWDYLVNALAVLAETLLFYHPGAWWIAKVIRREREYCCDDLAAEACGRPVVYASALTRLEELRVGGADALALGATGGGGKMLADRVRRVLGVGGESSTRGRRSVLATAVILGLLLPTAACVVKSSGADQATAGVATKAGSAISIEEIGLRRIAPRDELLVCISDLTGPGSVTEREVRVGQSGKVSLPLIDRLEVSGMTEAEAEAAIRRAYDRAEVVRDAVVVVRVLPGSAMSFERVKGGQPVGTRVKAGDVVRVEISDLAGPGQMMTRQVRVSKRGTVELPYLEELKAGELTEPQLESAIRLAYAKARVVNAETVHVEILKEAGTVGPEAAKALVSAEANNALEDRAAARNTRAARAAQEAGGKSRRSADQVRREAEQEMRGADDVRRSKEQAAREADQARREGEQRERDAKRSVREEGKPRVENSRVDALEREKKVLEAAIAALAEQSAELSRVKGGAEAIARIKSSQAEMAGRRAEVETLLRAAVAELKAVEAEGVKKRGPASVGERVPALPRAPMAPTAPGAPRPPVAPKDVSGTTRPVEEGMGMRREEGMYYVSGVPKPGAYQMQGSDLTVRQALVAAGVTVPSKERADGVNVMIKRAGGEKPGDTKNIPLLPLISTGEGDERLRVGDVLMVGEYQWSDPERFYYVGGMVERPGAYQIQGGKVNLLQAIVAAGGDPTTAPGQWISLIRREGEKKEAIHNFMMASLIQETPMELKGRDIIMVLEKGKTPPATLPAVLTEKSENSVTVPTTRP